MACFHLRKIRICEDFLRPKKMSQNELARRIGTKNNQVRRIELGLSDCRINTLRKVAEALEVELGELLSE